MLYVDIMIHVDPLIKQEGDLAGFLRGGGVTDRKEVMIHHVVPAILDP